jgi:hypothetical protein
MLNFFHLPKRWLQVLAAVAVCCLASQAHAQLQVAIVSATNNSCFGESDGVATASATGGVAPYAYLWSNGATTATISELLAGTYNVTATDAEGATATASVTISQPALALAASIDGTTDVWCFGASTGMIDLGVSGGTAPYSYAWSNLETTEDISGLAAGTYTVTVTDANGCTATASATVSEPASAIAAVINSTTNVSCFGESSGMIDLSVSGGTAPYTFAWDNGATTEDLAGLQAGSYNVTVTDANGCRRTASAIIREPSDLPFAALNSETDVSCFGGSDGAIDVSAGGGTAPYTFVWDNGATTEDLSGIEAGSYNVMVTDANGCTATAAFSINEPTPYGNISVSPLTTDFGTVAIGAQASIVYTATNEGAESITLSSISSDNPDFSVSYSQATVPPGETASFEVTFSPSNAGPAMANLSIAGSDCNQVTFTVSVTGTAYAMATASLSSPGATVSGPFTVEVAFSERMMGLRPRDFETTNARVTDIAVTDAANYTITVQPINGGDISISLPEGRAQSRRTGLGNEASNVIETYFDGLAWTCNPAAGNSDSDWVQRVRIDGQNEGGPVLDNNSGNNGGYANFDGLGAVSLQRGGLYLARIDAGRASNDRFETYRIWIDYNRDGDFFDPEEKTFARYLKSKAGVRGVFSVPADASLGQARMRVQMKYNGVPFTPCETLPFGETEDYLVELVDPAARQEARMAQGLSKEFALEEGESALSVYPNPARGMAQLQLPSDGPAVVEVLALDGRRVRLFQADGPTLDLDLSGLAPGLYVLAATPADGQRMVIKLTVE